MIAYKLYYSITEADFMEAYEAHWKSKKLSTRSNLYLGCIGIIAGIGLYFYMGLVGLLLSGSGLVLTLLPVIRYFLYIKAFRENKKYKDVIEVSFGEDEIETKTIDGESKLKWTVYISTLETPKFLLLYLSPNAFSIIPKSSLTEENKGFVEFAKTKISKQIAAHNSRGRVRSV